MTEEDINKRLSVLVGFQEEMQEARSALLDEVETYIEELEQFVETADLADNREASMDAFIGKLRDTVDSDFDLPTEFDGITHRETFDIPYGDDAKQQIKELATKLINQTRAVNLLDRNIF